jgi:hypothetical protein
MLLMRSSYRIAWAAYFAFHARAPGLSHPVGAMSPLRVRFHSARRLDY